METVPIDHSSRCEEAKTSALRVEREAEKEGDSDGDDGGKEGGDGVNGEGDE